MGSTIPISLVLPVLIDAMVDGFLIGLSAAISFRVGETSSDLTARFPHSLTLSLV